MASLGVALGAASLGLVLGSVLGAVIDIRFVLGLAFVGVAVLVLLVGRASARQLHGFEALDLGAADVGVTVSRGPYDLLPFTTRFLSRGILVVTAFPLLVGAGLILLSQLEQSTPACFWARWVCSARES